MASKSHSSEGLRGRPRVLMGFRCPRPQGTPKFSVLRACAYVVPPPSQAPWHSAAVADTRLLWCNAGDRCRGEPR